MSAAYIPTPIYFGAVIDTTCMLWQQDCGVHGSCWEYDVTSFRFVYFGLAASLKFVGFVFIFLTWYSIKYKEVVWSAGSGIYLLWAPSASSSVTREATRATLVPAPALFSHPVPSPPTSTRSTADTAARAAPETPSKQ